MNINVAASRMRLLTERCFIRIIIPKPLVGREQCPHIMWWKSSLRSGKKEQAE